MKTIAMCFIDREGNKKVTSLSVPDSTTEQAATVFANAVQGFSAAKMLSHSLVPSAIPDSDTFTPGVHDLVGEVARLRFVNASSQPFSFAIPAPVNGILDDDEEVDPDSAVLVRDALETVLNTTVYYRGGRLIVKQVSNPVKVPDLTSGT